jgi:hypothetical protein
LVKTTPKPRATKKRRGELLELLGPLEALLEVGKPVWAVVLAGGDGGEAIVWLFMAAEGADSAVG